MSTWRSRRFPDNAEIQVERAKMDMEALEFDKAEARLRQVLEKNPLFF